MKWLKIFRPLLLEQNLLPVLFIFETQPEVLRRTAVGCHMSSIRPSLLKCMERRKGMRVELNWL
jgi:hypothetical protein